MNGEVIPCLMGVHKVKYRRSKDWERFGAKDPYFGVVSHEEYHANSIEQHKVEFFDSGEKYVDYILSEFQRGFDCALVPSLCVDFGVGVGRVLLPLSRHCRQIVGVDVSPPMLKIAEANCVAKGVTNASFLTNIQFFKKEDIRPDFVHSYIVFQHMKADEGYAALDRFLSLLKPGGYGVVHVTFKRAFSFWQETKYMMITRCRPIWYMNNIRKHRSVSYPLTLMTEYDLNRILEILYRFDCHKNFWQFTNHGSVLGILLFFHKQRTPSV